MSTTKESVPADGSERDEVGSSSAPVAATNHLDELFETLDASFKEKLTAVPAELKFLLDGQDKVDVEQIGIEDGFMNFIYRISQKNQCVVVKWARQMPRIAEAEVEKHNIQIDETDEGYKEFESQQEQMMGRTSIEYKALAKLEKEVPGSAPKLYWFDPKRNFFIMEYLDGYDTLRQLIINGDIREEVFVGIARFMAQLHRNTHVKSLTDDEWKELKATYMNEKPIETLSQWFHELVFTKDLPVPNPRIYSKELEEILPEWLDNAEMRPIQDKLRESFLHTQRCFVHNDPHPGAFMINDENDIRVIDPEFSYVGNPAREVGYFLGEVVLFYYVNKGLKRENICARLVQCAKTTITEYLEQMNDLVEDREVFMQYVSAHAGHFGGIRIIGMVTLPQFENLPAEEAQCARVTIKLLKQMEKVTSLEKFIALAFE